MHLYMHSSKITKQKKIKFHSFIYAFLKNNKTKKNQVLCIHKCILLKKKKEQYQKGKNNSSIQACIFIQKIHKISCIHKCIFQKKNKIKKTKRIHAFKHAFSFKKFTKF